MMDYALPLIWLMIIGFCILMYVVLDGFTLGTGMLLPFLNDQERDIAISVLLPTWDGNQTWLVLGLASLYGAFPLAFSTLLPILYLPLLLMAITLLFRGVIFEFRLKSRRGKSRWDIIFAAASLLTTLLQGLILGDFVTGFNLDTPYPIFSAFTLLTAVSLVLGYCLLGSTRLILKTSGLLQKKMRYIAKLLAYALMLAIFIISIWTPYVYPLVMSRWFNLHYMGVLAILPFVTVVCFLGLLWSLRHQKERLPYWLSVILFLCPYAGFIISIFPYLVPYHINLWQAASPTSTLIFLLVGTVIMLPTLLVYTWYAYRIFRGKVNETIHY